MKYAVKFMPPLTGQKIDVFVDLTREQEADVRGQRHASPDHPLAKRYAIENAVKRAPRGYILVRGEDSLGKFASMIPELARFADELRADPRFEASATKSSVSWARRHCLTALPGWRNRSDRLING